MKSGYTEAELLALEWSKQNKKKLHDSSSTYEKRNNNYEEYSRSSRRDSSRDRNDRYSRDNNRKQDELYDEFGRLKQSAVQRDNSRHNRSSRRSRSRSRSRSPQRIKRRDYDDVDDNNNDYHRREKQRMIDSDWSHDKFDRESTNSPRRVRDPDYRPPAPKWISKAGGVAIINRNADT